jgi:hypothetical protein
MALHTIDTMEPPATMSVEIVVDITLRGRLSGYIRDVSDYRDRRLSRPLLCRQWKLLRTPFT